MGGSFLGTLSKYVWAFLFGLVIFLNLLPEGRHFVAKILETEKKEVLGWDVPQRSELYDHLILVLILPYSHLCWVQRPAHYFTFSRDKLQLPIRIGRSVCLAAGSWEEKPRISSCSSSFSYRPPESTSSPLYSQLWGTWCCQGLSLLRILGY